MEFFDLVKKRRSIRDYTGKPVPYSYLIKILDAARWAPSAGNTQEWKFIIVTDSKLKEKIAEYSYNQAWIQKAGVVIVVCADLRAIKARYPNRGEFYAICDGASATQNILLAAEDLGLGACWVGAFDEEKIKIILNIPDHVKVVSIVPIGHKSSEPATPYKYGLMNLTYINKWGGR